MPYDFHDTTHAEERAKQRGFTIDQAKEAINAPKSIVKVPPRQGNHGGMIWLFFRPFGLRLLVVVAEVKNNECWIITGYWEG